MASARVHALATRISVPISAPAAAEMEAAAALVTRIGAPTFAMEAARRATRKQS